MVIGQQPFQGPVAIRIEQNDREEIIGHELAEGLFCTIVEDSEDE